MCVTLPGNCKLIILSWIRKRLEWARMYATACICVSRMKWNTMLSACCCYFAESRKNDKWIDFNRHRLQREFTMRKLWLTRILCKICDSLTRWTQPLGLYRLIAEGTHLPTPITCANFLGDIAQEQCSPWMRKHPQLLQNQYCWRTGFHVFVYVCVSVAIM